MPSSRVRVRRLRLLIALLLGFGLLAAASAQGSWRDVEKLIGSPGELTQSGSFSVSVLRTDLQIQNAAGMLVAPEMGLASRVTFSRTPSDCSAAGELCVLAPEIDPVIDALRGGGVDIVGLTNRMAGEEPAVYFLSFKGHGTAANVARAIKKGLDALGRERPVNQGLQRTGAEPLVDWKAVEAILGTPVERVGSSRVMRAVIHRGESVEGWTAFGGCPCGRTQLTGELSVKRDDLQAIIDALRRSRIGITAIRPDLAGAKADRRLIDIAAEGDALRLASGVRLGCDSTGK